MAKELEKNERLLQARTRRQWTQADLADQICTTPLNVNRWEQGKTRPGPHFRQQLTRVFGMTEEELGLTKHPGTEILSPALAETSLFPPIHDTTIPLSPAVPLVGREDDLVRIRAQLNNPGSSVVVTALNGLPGVGKTSLAIAIAYDREIRETFADGILWAALGPKPNLPGQLSRWARRLGLYEPQFADLGEDQKRAQLRSAIGKRSMLLVLDDVWKVEDALALHVGGPFCAYLVTTRFPILATQLAIGNAMLISELDEERSFQLLRTLAPAVADLEEEKTRALAKAVGGLPLALTLLGNYLRRHSYGNPARRIVAALEQLNNVEVRLQISEPHVQAEAHPSIASSIPISLESIIAISDHFLTPGAREVFYALSVFPPKPESFSEEAALTVAACSTNELDELLDAGLIEVQGKDRYRLHQILADYARQHLDGRTEHIVMSRLCTFLCAYIEQHAKAYEFLEQEITLILYALEIAVRDDTYKEQVQSLIYASAPYLLIRGYYKVTQRFLERALALATASNNIRDETTILLFLGDVCFKLGHLTDALALYVRGKQLTEQLGDDVLLTTLLYRLGRDTWKLGNYTQAEKLLLEGLELARKTSQLAVIAEICRLLAAVYSNHADYERGEAYAREGLAIARQLGDRELMISLLINWGCCLGGSQPVPEKEPPFREAIQIAREIKSDEQLSTALCNLGDYYTHLDDLPQAETCLREAVLISRRLGHVPRLASSLSMLGIALRRAGDLSDAEECIKEALTLARDTKIQRYICIALDETGNLALARNNAQLALEAFQEMHRLCPPGDTEIEAVSLYGMSRAYEQLGQHSQALSTGKLAQTLVQEKKQIVYSEQIEAWYEKCQSFAPG